MKLPMRSWAAGLLSSAALIGCDTPVDEKKPEMPNIAPKAEAPKEEAKPAPGAEAPKEEAKPAETPAPAPKDDSKKEESPK